MDADLDRQPERFDRRSGADRRVAGRRLRRSSDREQLITVTDEEAVQLRARGYVRPLLVHTVPPPSEPALQFDAEDRLQPSLLARVRALFARVLG